MTNFLQHTAAALAAVLIVAATWAPVIAVPADTAIAVALAPALA